MKFDLCTLTFFHYMLYAGETNQVWSSSWSSEIKLTPYIWHESALCPAQPDIKYPLEIADWNELFTTKCVGCGFPIEAGDRWVEALNNNYHSQCFKCTVSRRHNTTDMITRLSERILIEIKTRSKQHVLTQEFNCSAFARQYWATFDENWGNTLV